MKIHAIAVFMALSAAAGAAAETNLVVGDHHLLPDLAGQTIPLSVQGDDQVRGFNLRAHLGDGFGPIVEPVFTGVDFTGGLWGDDITVLGGPVAGAEQFAQSSVAITDALATVPSDGLVAKVIVSTVGLSSGTYPLSLSGTEIGQDTDFVTVGGATFVPNITNGSVTIVPEPGSSCLFLVAIACLAARLRIRRQ